MDPWPKLRQLLVVTGAVTFLKAKGVTKEDYNQAAVLTASVKRRLMRLALFKTPFGVVILAERLKEVRRLFRDVTHEVDAFQEGRTTCRLDNFMLWERLEGNRRVAVENWVAANRDVYGVADAIEPDVGVNERPYSGASLAAEPGPEGLPAETAAVEGAHAEAGLAPAATTLHAVGEGSLAVPGGLGSTESSAGESSFRHEEETTPVVS